MFLKHSQIAPARASGLVRAAEAAVRAIPPAFPLAATVAVNPFLGQSGEGWAQAGARLARVAGAVLTPSRADRAEAVARGEIDDEALTAALIASRAPGRPQDLADLKARLHHRAEAAAPLPTLAELAAARGGTDWPLVIERSLGLWAAGYFDRGQALWQPAPGLGAYAAWRAWASRDLTPEIAGLKGFCAHVAAAPDTAERAVLRAAERLGVTEEAAETLFHRLLITLGGWAQMARGLLFQAELKGGTDSTLADLLAIRLIWEEALLAADPGLAAPWAKVVAAHAAPLAPSADLVIDAVLQEAAERSYQRRLAAELRQAPMVPVAPAAAVSARPVLQAAFCIDVRSEVFRRALEVQDSGIETLGFAGFFGLPVAHRAAGSVQQEAHLPALLTPALHSHAGLTAPEDEAQRISARALRAWGRFRQAAVSSFAFIEAGGPFYAGKLVKDALSLGGQPAKASPAPVFATEVAVADQAGLAARILRAMGLAAGPLAPVVLLVGHGASMVNNPLHSAYHCGACGGQTGEVSARLLAQMLNDAAVRAALAADHGVALPEDCRFVAGLHDTTTDAVTLFADAGGDLAGVEGWLAAAGALARAERAGRLPGARGAGDVAARALDWAELRPEWGLAGCAAFIAAPRRFSRGVDLGGRAFLHSYDWRRDPGFATLELILTAPVVVASWISLQYLGSAVAPEVFGGGNKLLHNVTGGLGVVEGNGGMLRAGLPWQAIHDGERLRHDPLRLSVLIEAPAAEIAAILARHPQVQALFDNGWMSLLTLKDGQMDLRYQPGGGWRDWSL